MYHSFFYLRNHRWQYCQWQYFIYWNIFVWGALPSATDHYIFYAPYPHPGKKKHPPVFVVLGYLLFPCIFPYVPYTPDHYVLSCVQSQKPLCVSEAFPKYPGPVRPMQPHILRPRTEQVPSWLGFMDMVLWAVSTAWESLQSITPKNWCFSDIFNAGRMTCYLKK